MDEIVCGGRSHWCVCGVKYIANKNALLKKYNKMYIFLLLIIMYIVALLRRGWRAWAVCTLLV